VSGNGKKDEWDWLRGVPAELAGVLRGGKIEQAEHFCRQDALPPGFTYPLSYRQFVEAHPKKMKLPNSWGYTSDVAGGSLRYSKLFNRPLVLFAQAFGEDMVACFDAVPGPDPRVVVLNPWGEPEPFTIAELPNFAAWLAWVAQDARDMGRHGGNRS
jgi:hypothetical protein